MSKYLGHNLEELASKFGKDVVDCLFRKIDRPYSFRDKSPEAQDFHRRYTDLLRVVRNK